MDTTTTFDELTRAIVEVVRVAREYLHWRELEVEQGVGGGADWWNKNQAETFERARTARSLILDVSEADAQQLRVVDLLTALDQLEFTWVSEVWSGVWDDDALRRYKLIEGRLFDQTIGVFAVRDYWQHRQREQEQSDSGRVSDPISNVDLAKLAGYEDAAHVSRLIRVALRDAGQACRESKAGRRVHWTHSQLRVAWPHLPDEIRLKTFLAERFPKPVQT